MKTLFIVLLILSGIPAFARDQEHKLNCRQFRNGKFRLEDSLSGTTIIERHDSLQTEYGNDKVVIELKVKWLDDCTYTLVLNRVVKDPDGETKNWPAGLVLTVSITDITEDSYIQTTSANIFPLQLVGKVTRIK